MWFERGAGKEGVQRLIDYPYIVWVRFSASLFKGQVIRAIFSHNLSRNIVALQVEKGCYPYYHRRSQLVTQQISMLQVAALKENNAL